MHLRRSLFVVLAAPALLGACSGGSSSGESSTTPDRVRKVIAAQTAIYERAGASHDDAACLAKVTGRMKAPDAESGLLLASIAQDEAIRRCNLPAGALAKIGNYVRTHPPKSH